MEDNHHNLSEEFQDADEDSDFEPEDAPAPVPYLDPSRSNDLIPERGLYPETRKFLLTQLDEKGGPEAISRDNKLLEQIINKYPRELGQEDTTPLLYKRVRTCAYHWKRNPKLLKSARKNLAGVALHRKPAVTQGRVATPVGSKPSLTSPQELLKAKQPPTKPTRTSTNNMSSKKLYSFGSPSRGTPGRGRRKKKADDCEFSCLI